jgi:hypothetical protein
MVAQTYLYTTRPSPGDPREHMHRAALQGLRMVGNKLTAKMRRRIATKEHINQGHNVVTIVLGTEVAADDLEHHHQGDTKVRSMEEPEDLGPPQRHTTMKMTKKRWGHRALLTGFAPCQYPRVSNYPMISKNTMDLRSPNHGSRITCRK